MDVYVDYMSLDLRTYDFGTTCMTDVLTTGNLLLSSTHLCFIIFSYTEALKELFPFRPVSVHRQMSYVDDIIQYLPLHCNKCL